MENVVYQNLLLLYFEGQHDITPLGTQVTNATIQTFLKSRLLVTITSSTAHGLEPGDLFRYFVLPGSSGCPTSDFIDRITNVLSYTISSNSNNFRYTSKLAILILLAKCTPYVELSTL